MKLEFLEAGEIVTTHGVRGEMKIYPWSDGPEFLLDFDRVLIDKKVYNIESCRIQKTCNLLKLEGIDSVEDAQKMRGKTVEVYRKDALADMIFVPELIGMDVIADGVQIGKVADVLDYPGNKVYVIEGEHQYMVPAVKQFILSTDMENNVMQIHIIEGMRTDES